MSQETAEIRKVQDKNGVQFFPITHLEAVIDSEGNTIQTTLNQKQDTLVSGTTIKTINDTSILGRGNINLDSEYHPYGGDGNVDFSARSVSSSSASTVGNGHTGTTSSEDGYRRMYFGSISHYIEFKNFGTEQEPVWAFQLSDPLVGSDGRVIEGEGLTPTPVDVGIEHVLLSQAEWDVLQNPDPSTIYLVYED